MHRRSSRRPLGLAAALLALCTAGALGCTSDSGSSGLGDTGAADAALSDVNTACDSLSCGSFDLAPASSRYDASSHVLTLGLKGSAPNVMGGSISFTFARRNMGTGVQSAVFRPNGRTMTADLTPWLGQTDAIFFGGLSITLVSQCGATFVITNLEAVTQSGAGGIVISSLRCM